MTPQKPDLKELQKVLKVKFKNPSLLDQAMVHRSSLNESRNKFSESNERFEFLGDAALELWSSTVLFSRFPKLAEGELTNLKASKISLLKPTIKIPKAYSRKSPKLNPAPPPSTLSFPKPALTTTKYLKPESMLPIN